MLFHHLPLPRLLPVPRLLRIPLSGLAFLFFYGGAFVVAFVVLPIKRRRARGLSQAARRADLDQFFLGLYRLMITAWDRLGLMHHRLPDLSHLPPGPRVIVANHPSLIDVLFIKACVPGVVVLAKSALFRAPALRQIFEASGDFEGPDQSQQNFGATAVLDIFVAKLNEGRSVLVFPEGTRSPPWRLNRFRRGAAEAAIRGGVTILPIFVLNDPPTLKKGDKWYDMPARVPRFDLEALPLIDPAGRDSREVTAELRDLFAARLEAARIDARQD